MVASDDQKDQGVDLQMWAHGKIRPNGPVLASVRKKFEPHPQMVGGMVRWWSASTPP